MDHQKALEILMHLESSTSLSEQQKEAISTAIGVLGWTALGKNRMKAIKAKREKDTEW